MEMKLVFPTGSIDKSEPDLNLVNLIARAHHWQNMLSSGEVVSVQEIADRDHVDAGDVSRILPLAFLAPDIVESILEGRQPKEWTAERFKRARDIPLSWDDQRMQLGFLPNNI